MQNLGTLLLENLPEILSLLVGLVSFCIVWYKTKSFNIAINSYKEVLEDMKFKSPYDSTQSYTQSYVGANLKKQYHYNEQTRLLEELPNKIDTQAQIDSYREVALNNVLDRFLPTSDDIVDEVAVVNQKVSKLDEMLALSQKADEYRKSLGLSPDLSVGEVFAEVQKRAEEMKIQLTNYINNKESINDEKKNIKESK